MIGEPQSAFHLEAQEALGRAQRHFQEFIRVMELTKRQVTADYELDGLTQMTGLLQGEYQLSAPGDTERMNQVALSFECAREGAISYCMNEPRVKIHKLEKYLDQHGITFNRWEDEQDAKAQKKRDKIRVTFHIENRIAGSIRISADMETKHLILTRRNLESLGEERFPIEPKRIDNPFLHELTNLLLRKPNRLDQLMGFKLTDTRRFRLQSKLRQAAIAKRREMESQESHEEGLIDRMLGLFGKR